MRECDTDMILVRAQVGGFFVMLVAVIALVIALIFFHSQMSDTVLALVTSAISVLLTIFTLMSNYMYARQRPHTTIDPPTLPDPVTPPPSLPGAPSAANPLAPKQENTP